MVPFFGDCFLLDWSTAFEGVLRSAPEDFFGDDPRDPGRSFSLAEEPRCCAFAFEELCEDDKFKPPPRCDDGLLPGLRAAADPEDEPPAPPAPAPLLAVDEDFADFADPREAGRGDWRVFLPSASEDDEAPLGLCNDAAPFGLDPFPGDFPLLVGLGFFWCAATAPPPDPSLPDDSVAVG